jgi:hypothetical protein
MKITAIVVLKPAAGAGASSSGGGPGSEALVLANATDVSHFGFFQRGAAREFIVFVARTVAQRTQPGQRQSVQHEGNRSPQICRHLGLHYFAIRSRVSTDSTGGRSVGTGPVIV